MPSPDLDIGVIYTGERELMPRLLTTMSAAGPGLRTRLVLIDNASPDGVKPWREYLADTLVLNNCARLTYAANLNRVLQAATARYVLLMNTDMYFDPSQQCLRQMVEFMDGRPQCGIAGCRLYHADGSEARAARRFQTVPLVLGRRCGMSRLLRRTIDHHFYAEHLPEETFACDWISGCFMMVRRAAIAEVGGFDEGYKKYFEDVDMCLRMAWAGWQVMYNGRASCYHLEQRASKKLLSADAWRHLRSYLRWLRKWGYRPAAVPAQKTHHRKAA